MITRDVLASQLRNYLQHRITRAALVDWAERAMMDERFDERDLDALRDITARLGLADVREFGLTREDCERRKGPYDWFHTPPAPRRVTGLAGGMSSTSSQRKYLLLAMSSIGRSSSVSPYA